MRTVNFGLIVLIFDFAVWHFISRDLSSLFFVVIGEIEGTMPFVFLLFVTIGVVFWGFFGLWLYGLKLENKKLPIV